MYMCMHVCMYACMYEHGSGQAIRFECVMMERVGMGWVVSNGDDGLWSMEYGAYGA